MSLTSLLEEARRNGPWVVGLRREQHRFPKLQFEEFRTSELVRKTLTELWSPWRDQVTKIEFAVPTECSRNGGPGTGPPTMWQSV